MRATDITTGTEYAIAGPGWSRDNYQATRATVIEVGVTYGGVSRRPKTDGVRVSDHEDGHEHVVRTLDVWMPWDEYATKAAAHRSQERAKQKARENEQARREELCRRLVAATGSGDTEVRRSGIGLGAYRTTYTITEDMLTRILDRLDAAGE